MSMGILTWLEGKKTYLSAAGGVVITLSYLFGFVDDGQMGILLALFGFSGLAALRSAIKKLME